MIASTAPAAIFAPMTGPSATQKYGEEGADPGGNGERGQRLVAHAGAQRFGVLQRPFLDILRRFEGGLACLCSSIFLERFGLICNCLGFFPVVLCLCGGP